MQTEAVEGKRMEPGEAAAYLGVHPNTLAQYRRAGVRVRGQVIHLPAVPTGARGVYYRLADLDGFRAAIAAARNLATTVGPRPETEAEFARRAAADVEAFNRGR